MRAEVTGEDGRMFVGTRERMATAVIQARAHIGFASNELRAAIDICDLLERSVADSRELRRIAELLATARSEIETWGDGRG